jgi:hypothetical protein
VGDLRSGGQDGPLLLSGSLGICGVLMDGHSCRYCGQQTVRAVSCGQQQPGRVSIGKCVWNSATDI